MLFMGALTLQQASCVAPSHPLASSAPLQVPGHWVRLDGWQCKPVSDAELRGVKSYSVVCNDVPYWPSPPHVVAEMLQIAKVGPKDLVYDLGCGDGRIVIAAVRDHGARGVCIDIDPERIREAQQNAKAEGVDDRIEFRTQDLFEADLTGATVVTLYLWPEVNVRLRPKLQRELKPGTRTISYMHDMGDWKPDRTITVIDDGKQSSVYLWIL
jgi:SAM-dependent methyltransferase